MNPNEYQKMAMRTNDGKDSERLQSFLIKVDTVNRLAKLEGKSTRVQSEELICGAMGLNGEAGEVVDLLKKYIFHGHKFVKEDLVKELGDVLWYVALICDSLGIPMEEVMEKNIKKLKERYPEGFTEKSKHKSKRLKEGRLK